MKILLAIPGAPDCRLGLEWAKFHRISTPQEAEQILSAPSDFDLLVLCLCSAASSEQALPWRGIAKTSGLPVVLVGADPAILGMAADLIGPAYSLMPGTRAISAVLGAQLVVNAIGSSKDQESLEDLRKQSEAAIRLKNDFLAAMSHELRTPLNAIIGFSDIMLDGAFKELAVAQHQEYVTAINKSGKTLLRTIEDLQTLAATSGMACCGDNNCRDLIDLVPDLVCLCLDNKIVSVNAAGAELLGPTSPDRLIGRDFRSFIQAGSTAVGNVAELSGHSLRVPLSLRSLSGETRYVEAAATLFPLDQNTAAVFLLARDISDSMRQARHIRDSEDGFSRLMNFVGDAVLLLDNVGAIMDANSVAAGLFRCDRQIMLQRPFPSLFLPDDALTYEASFPQLPIRGNGVRFDGRSFPAQITYERFLVGDQERLLTIVRDIGDETRLRTLAYRDQRTGLPNKAFLLEHISHLTSRLEGDSFAVVLADIDHYKTLCGLHGEDLGTEALARLACRLGPFESERVLVAKSGNDEFAIVFDGTWSIEHLPLSQLQEAIRTPTKHEGLQVQLTATLGISFYPEDGLDGETLLRHAAAAVRYAKDEPGREPQRFTPAVAVYLRERSMLEQGVRLAAKRGELSVAYQPKVDLMSGMVIGAEALVRWNSPELGMVSPAAFIPVAERGGAIVEIGDWVFDEVCREMAPHLSGNDGFRVSVNLSPRQFLQPRLAKKLRRAMDRFGIDGCCIDIEVTEGMLLGGDEIIQRNMADLKDINLTISLDDFGTCYSSLAYLSRFPLDTIKIDKAFLQGVPHDRGNVAITTAIIAMARGLGLSLVAEGIETVEQRDFLIDQDCRVAQGYLFGRPTPIGDFPWARNKLPC